MDYVRYAAAVTLTLVCLNGPAAGDDYGLTVEVREDKTGCSQNANDGAIHITNNNPGAWLRLKWYGISETKNVFFRNGPGAVPQCGFAPDDTECNNNPELCECYGDCKPTTCPERNKFMCSSLGGGCTQYPLTCCADCGCEISRSDLLDPLDRLLGPSADYQDGCALPSCNGTDCAGSCDNDLFECFFGTPWCTQLVTSGGSGIHVEITDISFDGTCFLTSEAAELPVSLETADIDIVNLCSE